MKTTKLISKAILAACLCLGMAACGDDNGDNPGGGGGDHGGPGSRLKFTELAFEGNDNRHYYFTYRASDLYSWPYVLNRLSWSLGLPGGSRSHIDYTYTMGATGGSTIKTDYGRTCEVNPDGLVIHYTYSASQPPYQTLEEALFTYDDNRQLKEITQVTDNGNGARTKFTWKNGNITKVECINANGETRWTDTYTYTSEPSWKGITFISGITDDDYMKMLFYTGEYFGKRPKNLIASRKRGDNTVKFEYTYYTAPHPAEGYVYETKLDDDITYTFTWEGTAE